MVDTYWSWVMKGIYIGDYYWLSGVNSYVIGQGYWPPNAIIEHYEEPGEIFDGYNVWLYCPRSYFIIGFHRSMTLSIYDTSDKLSRLDGIWCGRPSNTVLYEADCHEQATSLM